MSPGHFLRSFRAWEARYRFQRSRTGYVPALLWAARVVDKYCCSTTSRQGGLDLFQNPVIWCVQMAVVAVELALEYVLKQAGALT
jgi:hypothetical protein